MTSDRAIHGGEEDTCYDTERALRQKIESQRVEIELWREFGEQFDRFASAFLETWDAKPRKGSQAPAALIETLKNHVGKTVKTAVISTRSETTKDYGPGRSNCAECSATAFDNDGGGHFRECSQWQGTGSDSAEPTKDRRLSSRRTEVNDEEIIRKAVELAEGFDVNHECFDILDARGRLVCAFDWDDRIPQFALDALAAQLVRQVDAIENEGNDPHSVIAYKFSVEVTGTVDHRGITLALEEGTDRTMNTLRAIVESRVLEGQENE